MSSEQPPVNLLRFPGASEPPGGGGPGGDEPIEAWPTFGIEVEEIPDNPLPWLESELVFAVIRALSFQRGTARLGTIELAAVRPAVRRFEQSTARLVRGIELLRLRSPSVTEVRSIVSGVIGVLDAMRQTRVAVFEGLEEDDKRRLLLRERRAQVTPRCVEDEIARRARRRQSSGRQEAAQFLQMGEHATSAPSEEALASRARRAWRHEEDHKPIAADAGVLQLLARMPQPWLTAIYLRLGGHAPGESDGVGVNASAEDVAARLMQPRILKDLVRGLTFGPRRALEICLEAGGMCRYEHLRHLCGPDDETAWFWPLDPPRSDLERLRRAGLLFSGTCELDGQLRRVAVVPTDLRAALARLMNEYPPPPVRYARVQGG